MPITLDRRPDERLVVFSHIGEVSDDEMLAFYRDFLDDPGSAGYLMLLIHLDQTRSTGRSSEALRSLAGLFEEKFGDVTVKRRVAVVAPADNSFGLARMYEALSARVPWEFRVFRDGDAALAWLGDDVNTDGPDAPGS